MSAPFASSAVIAGVRSRPGTWRIFGLASRYGLSILGPVAVSIAHFFAAVLLMRALTQSAFGLFSFELILVPFCLSMVGALLGPSLSAAIVKSSTLAAAELATHMKVNLLFSILALVAITGLMMSLRAGLALSVLFGLYGALMTLRNFARTYVYATGNPLRVTISDFVYAGLLIAGQVLVTASYPLPANAIAIFVGACAAAFLPFGGTYLRDQFFPRTSGSLRAYGLIWRDLARWSLCGVVLTELTVNAHAYVVTFVSGSKTFALLAAGALFMRPVALSLSALPDLERPLMARKIASGDGRLAADVARDFRVAVILIWAATVAIAAALLIWAPRFALRADYPLGDVAAVVALWALIMAVRTMRTPESVLLQAACQYRNLMRPAVWSSAVSIVLTVALLFAVGPIASLIGILAGDVVMTAGIFGLSRKWKAAHD